MVGLGHTDDAARRVARAGGPGPAGISASRSSETAEAVRAARGSDRPASRGTADHGPGEHDCPTWQRALDVRNRRGPGISAAFSVTMLGASRIPHSASSCCAVWLGGGRAAPRLPGAGRRRDPTAGRSQMVQELAVEANAASSLGMNPWYPYTSLLCPGFSSHWRIRLRS